MKDNSMSNERQITFARRYRRNQFFSELYGRFSELAETEGFKKTDIANFLGKDAAQISRWFSEPSNLSLDSISDLLLAMDAELEVRVVPATKATTTETVAKHQQVTWVSILEKDSGMVLGNLNIDDVLIIAPESGTAPQSETQSWEEGLLKASAG